MNIFSKQQKMFHNRSIFISLIPCAVFPLACVTFFTLYFPVWHIISEPVHSLLEGIGGFSAIILSLFIIIMRRNQLLRPNYLWVAAAFIGMGIFDGFHASVSPMTPTCYWLRSLANLFGGLTFSLLSLPDRISNMYYLRSIHCLVAIGSFCIGVFTLLHPEAISFIAENGTYSLTAKLMNITGGIGFIIACFVFCFQNDGIFFARESIILANYCIFFGVAAIFAPFFDTWHITWWFWHVLHLLAYLSVLWFFLDLYNKDAKNIRENEFELKQRTQELERIRIRLSDIIDYSPAVISLKDRFGIFMLVNKQFSRIFGYSQNDVVGKTMFDIFQAEAAILSAKEDEKVIRLSCNRKREEEYVVNDGKKKTFISERFPLRDSDKNIYGIGCIMTDITDRKNSDIEIRKLLDENKERVKELDCLYGMSKLSESQNFELRDILKKMVYLISSSLKYSQYVGVRIILNDIKIATDNFNKTKYIQESSILINGEERGCIQICYAEKNLDVYNGKIFKDELHFINEISVRIGNIIQQKIAEKELRKAFEFNDKIIEEFPIGLSIYDQEGQCIAANSSMEELTGFSREKLLCQNYNEIDYWEESGLCRSAKQSIVNRQNERREFDIITASGQHIFFECTFVPFTLHDELRLLLMIDNISERKKAEEQLKSTLSEKESLLKEIHHRVKNNMQIVASLMFLQAQNSTNKEALSVLQDSQDRVKSMGLVHELLYRSENLSKVPFKEYIETLVQSLRESYQDSNKNVSCHVESEVLELPVDTAIPCGLIVNELITNSFKHAFKENNSGSVNISFIRQNDIYILSVHDTGLGLPAGYDWKSSKTLGLNLIRTLSEQLDANVEFENNNGLKCIISFKIYCSSSQERSREVI